MPDVLFWGLEASPLAWISFQKSQRKVNFNFRSAVLFTIFGHQTLVPEPDPCSDSLEMLVSDTVRIKWIRIHNPLVRTRNRTDTVQCIQISWGLQILGESKQCCGSGSGIWCLFYPWIRDPGREKIKIRIRDEHYGSYIRELRNNFLG